MFQIASPSSAEGRSKRNVPKVKRRRNSGGRLTIELQVAMNEEGPRAPASTRRRRSPAAASMGSISPAARKSGKYEAASPVTSSPTVAKGKVVVATADGQVICFGSRQTPTVDSVSPKGVHFHSSSMQ